MLSAWPLPLAKEKMLSHQGEVMSRVKSRFERHCHSIDRRPSAMLSSAFQVGWNDLGDSCNGRAGDGVGVGGWGWQSTSLPSPAVAHASHITFLQLPVLFGERELSNALQTLRRIAQSMLNIKYYVIFLHSFSWQLGEGEGEKQGEREREREREKGGGRERERERERERD